MLHSKMIQNVILQREIVLHELPKTGACITIRHSQTVLAAQGRDGKRALKNKPKSTPKTRSSFLSKKYMGQNDRAGKELSKTPKIAVWLLDRIKKQEL